MAHGAPDYTSSTIQLSVGGIPVAVAVGENYYTKEVTIAAGLNPTYTPTFTMECMTIYSTKELTLKLNDAGNDSITIQSGYMYIFTNMSITSIIIANTLECDIKIWGSD